MYKAYMNATSRLKEFNNSLHGLQERHEKAEREIKNHYYDLKRELEDEEYKLKSELKQKYDGYETRVKSKMVSHQKTLKEIEDILAFIKIYIDGRDLLFLIPTDDLLLYVNQDWSEEAKTEFERRLSTGDPWLSEPTYNKPFNNHFESFESIAEDEYKRITIEISQNRKPTNKYDLYLCITSIFDTQSSFSMVLKSGPTKESLITYWEHNKNKIRVNPPRWGGGKIIIDGPMTIAQILERFEKIQQKYEEAVNLIKTNPDWKLIYLRDQKHYYENNYSRGDQTEEYKLICKQLNIPLPKPEEEENEVA